MNNTFETLPWHDAELLEVTVDRRMAGECDEVRMRVAWPQGEKADIRVVGFAPKRCGYLSRDLELEKLMRSDSEVCPLRYSAYLDL